MLPAITASCRIVLPPILCDTAASGTPSGTLPQEWSTLGKLENLTLGSLSLNGPIPTSWSTLSSLKTMQVQHPLRVLGYHPECQPARVPNLTSCNRATLHTLI
jgi:hypothetical protein